LEKSILQLEEYAHKSFNLTQEIETLYKFKKSLQNPKFQVSGNYWGRLGVFFFKLEI
jgi:hypothetical protein